MAIKYTNIFHSKFLKTIPNFGSQIYYLATLLCAHLSLMFETGRLSGSSVSGWTDKLFWREIFPDFGDCSGLTSCSNFLPSSSFSLANGAMVSAVAGLAGERFDPGVNVMNQFRP
jgi:hypothetical protein